VALQQRHHVQFAAIDLLTTITEDGATAMDLPPIVWEVDAGVIARLQGTPPTGATHAERLGLLTKWADYLGILRLEESTDSNGQKSYTGTTFLSANNGREVMLQLRLD